MTLRNPDGTDEISNFANAAFYDLSFPKQSEDYSEISEYLELNGSYINNMDIFDKAFQMYTDKDIR